MSMPELWSTWRHKKRGTLYTVVDYATLQVADSSLDNVVCVIYKGADGSCWVRPVTEFIDGRFVRR